LRRKAQQSQHDWSGKIRNGKDQLGLQLRRQGEYIYNTNNWEWRWMTCWLAIGLKNVPIRIGSEVIAQSMNILWRNSSQLAFPQAIRINCAGAFRTEILNAKFNDPRKK
jgi:hypothetical protein